MDEQKLNRKLAEWAGLIAEIHVEAERKWERFHAPDGSFHPLIDFTQSLDACFKWLVPKYAEIIAQEHPVWDEEGIIHYLFRSWLREKRRTKFDFTLALCLAIEKLIDREE